MAELQTHEAAWKQCEGYWVNIFNTIQNIWGHDSSQGVLDWPPGINTLCASLSATSMFVTFLIPNEIVYL